MEPAMHFRYAVSCAALIALASCAASPARHGVRGPSASTRSTDPVLEREIADYVAAALFADERPLLDEPACAVEALVSGRARPDAQLVGDCQGASHRRGGADFRACAHACVARARADAARAAYAQTLDVVERLADAVANAHGACATMAQRLLNQPSGEPVRGLLACLGLGPLPEGAEPMFQFDTHEQHGRDEQGHTVLWVNHGLPVQYAEVELVLLPGGVTRKLSRERDTNPAPCARVVGDVCVRITSDPQ